MHTRSIEAGQTSYCASLCLALASALLVAACGGRSGDGGATNAEVVQPEVQQARELATSGLQRRAGFFPVVTAAGDEGAYLLQKDQQLANALGRYVISNRYASTLNRLATRAGISRVQAAVVSDLACTSVPFGGGVATDSLLALDGKLFDVLAEVANALALRETGRLVAPLEQIVDNAAARQINFANFCVASDPIAYPDSLLSAAEFDRSVEYFTQLAGGLFFHEFGHVWGWHTLIGLRDRILFPAGGIFSYTSAIEDNADITSGILSAKSGHDPAMPKLTYDLMAFTYFYRRNPGFVSFSNIQAWDTQYAQSAPTYSSLAVRKTLIDLGYSAWGRR